jgi:hypothetical protein
MNPQQAYHSAEFPQQLWRQSQIASLRLGGPGLYFGMPLKEEPVRGNLTGGGEI